MFFFSTVSIPILFSLPFARMHDAEPDTLTGFGVLSEEIEEIEDRAASIVDTYATKLTALVSA